MYIMFNQQEFNKLILDSKIIGIPDEPITMAYGRVSPYYVNWRNIGGDAFLLDKLTDFLIEFIKETDLNPDCIYGVPEGATKLGVITQLKWAKQQDNFGPNSHVLPMGRAVPKEHGALKDKFFVGMPTGKTVVVEDVTTTGGSLLKTLKMLKESGVNIIAAIGLTNRNEVRDDGKTVKQAVEDMGVKYYAISQAIDLLPLLNLNEEHIEQVLVYFKTYCGTTPNF